MTSELRPEKRIDANPYDVEAWNILMRDQQKKNIEECRPFYESLVTTFPNAGRYWKAYVEHELKAKNYQNVEKLFQRCLMKVLNIELWKCYLNYVRETKGQLNSFREKMAQAYDFALDKMGLDPLSYQIYQDYITFLKNVPAVGTFAENQKITAVRRIYQRAIMTPLTNIESLWNDYIAYERIQNAQLAEKLIADRSKDYNNARRVAKQYDATMRGINRNLISVPPRSTPTEIKQMDLWKKYILWEKENPLATDDHHLVAKRVMFAYEQALLCLGYYPDLWYESALFIREASKQMAEKGDAKTAQDLQKDVSNLYERGITGLLSKSMLIYFAYADYEEERMNFDKVKDIYMRIIKIEDVNPTLAYVQYMKFARRTEGILAARNIFKQAREDTRCHSQVYVAAALMEYYCSKESQVAFKIFELGLKKFGDKIDFAVAYVDYLSHLNEDNNTRVLFERILSSGNLPVEKSVEIWDRYLEFESLVGDLASITKVDKRRRFSLEQDFGNVPTALLIDRYKFMTLYPCTPEEIRQLGYQSVMSKLDPRSASTHGKSGGVDALRNCIVRGAVIPSQPDLVAAYPKPDTVQMLPFKPKIVQTSSYHPVPGGVYPPPPAVSHLLKIIPPPFCFNGPFVGIDVLMDKIRDCILPDITAPTGDISSLETPSSNPAITSKMEEIRKEFHQVLATTPDPLQILQQQAETGTTRKRHAANPMAILAPTAAGVITNPAAMGQAALQVLPHYASQVNAGKETTIIRNNGMGTAANDSDDEGASDLNTAPIRDLYRMRQLNKRVKTT